MILNSWAVVGSRQPCVTLLGDLPGCAGQVQFSTGRRPLHALFLWFYGQASMVYTGRSGACPAAPRRVGTEPARTAMRAHRRCVSRFAACNPGTAAGLCRGRRRCIQTMVPSPGRSGSQSITSKFAPMAPGPVPSRCNDPTGAGSIPYYSHAFGRARGLWLARLRPMHDLSAVPSNDLRVARPVPSSHSSRGAASAARPGIPSRGR